MGEPQPGAEIPITFGPSFEEGPAETSYSCFRYEFKPQSTKREREGTLVRTGKDIAIEFPGEGHPVAFTGHMVPSKDNLDCVLVFDGESVRLEQLTGTVMLKHTRGTGVGLGSQGRATPPLPPAAAAGTGSKKARAPDPETPASNSWRPPTRAAPAGGVYARGSESSSSDSDSDSDSEEEGGAGGAAGGLGVPTPVQPAYHPPSSAPLLPRFGVLGGLGVGLGVGGLGGGGGDGNDSDESFGTSGSSSDGDKSIEEMDEVADEIDVI